VSGSDRPAGPPDVPSGVLAVVERTLRAAPRLGPVRLVCVDGPAGSGKTTTAALVADVLAHRGTVVEVVHLDDLYDGWRGLEGTLWPRVTAQLLEPLRRGRPGRFQRYDWAAGTFTRWVDVPVAPVLVLEGCGAARRDVDPVASLRVWVAAPDDVRLARGLARDGEAERDHWAAWMADEREHFRRERTRERADLWLDGLGRLVVRDPRADRPARRPTGLA